jgi:farnesyl-diphosphate farnesyltransferase
MSFDDQLLKAVSRSFYLSMSFLPGWMRPAIGTAYLLARATDSVADTGKAPLGEKTLFFDQLRGALAGDGRADELCAMALRLAPAQEIVGERWLLEQMGACWASYCSLPEGDRGLIGEVLRTIMAGQTWDLSYFQEGEESRVTPELTRLYTYQVAGCVGEFWTKLGFLHQGEDFAICLPTQMLTWGVRYGCGLQLVNILRDMGEDQARGRFYVDPAEVPSWLDEARHDLEDGLRYARALRGWRLRFSSYLPARMGLATLDLIDAAGAEGVIEAYQTGKKLKISHGQVRALLMEAMLFALRGAE